MSGFNALNMVPCYCDPTWWKALAGLFPQIFWQKVTNPIHEGFALHIVTFVIQCQHVIFGGLHPAVREHDYIA